MQTCRILPPPSGSTRLLLRLRCSTRFGDGGRNILRPQSLKDLDLSLFREDTLTERIKVQFRAEFFNILNHPSFDVPQATITSPVFAAVSGTANSARQVQLGLKVLF
jgi:hypothetical protein